MAAPSIPGADRVGVSDFLARRAAEALGLGLLAAALAVAVALWGYDPNDPSLNHAVAGPSTNPLGRFGASVADVLQQTLGLAAWLIVLILPLWALRLIFAKPLAWPWLPVAALPLAMLATAAYLATRPLPDSWPFWVGLGGFVGDFILNRLERPIGPELYPTITGSIALVCVTLAIGLSVRELWQAARALVLAPFRLARRRRSEQDEPRWAQAIEQRYGAPPAPPRPRRPSGPGFGLVGRVLGGLAARLRPSRWRGEREVDLKRTIDPAIAATESARRRRPQPAKAEVRPPDSGTATVTPIAFKARAAPAEAGELLPDAGFTLPPLSFLAPPRQRGGVSLDRASLAETARALEKVLDDFGVRGEIVDVRPGPVVTLYELEPAPGTRAARVISLADDIARSLCAMSVRVATVPGRNVIGRASCRERV